MEQLAPLLPYVAILVIIWLLFLRPAQRRNRELRSMQQSLTVGDQILLTSGIFGIVDDLADDVVHLRVADDVVIKVARGAVGGVVDPERLHESQPDTEPEQPAGPEEN